MNTQTMNEVKKWENEKRKELQRTEQVHINSISTMAVI